MSLKSLALGCQEVLHLNYFINYLPKNIMNIAIVGATGNVGRKLIEVLEKKNFPITEAYLVASSNSEGKKINFLGKEHTVSNLEQFDF